MLCADSRRYDEKYQENNICPLFAVANYAFL
jgi:hypothetical protein